jgi:hypothetical protein
VVRACPATRSAERRNGARDEINGAINVRSCRLRRQVHLKWCVEPGRSARGVRYDLPTSNSRTADPATS